MVTEDATRDEAYIADAFYRVGILREEDWQGDLTRALNTALNRWVKVDCEADLSGLGIDEFIYTNNLEFIDAELYPDPSFPPFERGAFALVGGQVERYALGHNCTLLNRVHPRLGTTIFAYLQSILENYIQAVTPCSALHRWIQWSYAFCDDEEDEDREMHINEHAFRSSNPAGVLRYEKHGGLSRAKLARMRRIAKMSFDRGDSNHNVMATAAARMTLDLWKAEKKLERLGRDPVAEFQGIRAEPVPPMVLQWNPGYEDTVSRFADDQINYAMEEGEALVHMRGFWVPGFGQQEDGALSIDLAIEKMEATLKMLAIAQKMLQFFHSDEKVPARPKPFKPLVELFKTDPIESDSIESKEFVSRL